MRHECFDRTNLTNRRLFGHLDGPQANGLIRTARDERILVVQSANPANRARVSFEVDERDLVEGERVAGGREDGPKAVHPAVRQVRRALLGHLPAKRRE